MIEELERFNPLKYNGNLTQSSYDLFEEIKETLYNEDLKEDDIVRNIHHKITTILEICGPTFDDYKWLKGMLECFEKFNDQ